MLFYYTAKILVVSKASKIRMTKTISIRPFPDTRFAPQVRDGPVCTFSFRLPLDQFPIFFFRFGKIDERTIKYNQRSQLREHLTTGFRQTHSALRQHKSTLILCSSRRSQSPRPEHRSHYRMISGAGAASLLVPPPGRCAFRFWRRGTSPCVGRGVRNLVGVEVQHKAIASTGFPRARIHRHKFTDKRSRGHRQA